jgi:hypothetical protein
MCCRPPVPCRNSFVRVIRFLFPETLYSKCFKKSLSLKFQFHVRITCDIWPIISGKHGYQKFRPSPDLFFSKISLFLFSSFPTRGLLTLPPTNLHTKKLSGQMLSLEYHTCGIWPIISGNHGYQNLGPLLRDNFSYGHPRPPYSKLRWVNRRNEILLDTYMWFRKRHVWNPRQNPN